MYEGSGSDDWSGTDGGELHLSLSHAHTHTQRESFLIETRPLPPLGHVAVVVSPSVIGRDVYQTLTPHPFIFGLLQWLATPIIDLITTISDNV